MSEELRPEDMGPHPLVQVTAVAVSANAAAVGSTVGEDGAKLIQEAMSNAVTWCYGQGITDPVKVKEYMMVARANAVRDIAAAVTSQGN